ncbi:NUMOD4 motif-containing HNH endonuclease [Ligilactobacillus agilis]|uniref:NUMOD4 motif-containing HNH endonuclease n=1 Tax=Ligilactobacillus agilis TaxID=1601 RepID=UPI00067E97AD|nr:NUMOD4 motif-containing HNH endonuclease [Ligilactobacillus agilis]
MTEHWKPVKGYEELYEVSDLGRLRNSRTNYIYKPQKTVDGYLTVKLQGFRGIRRVHRLVVEAFDPPLTSKMEVDHLNEIKTDNRLSNLEKVSRKENQIRRYNRENLNETKYRFGNLSVLDVNLLKIDWLLGMETEAISKKYNISKTQVQHIGRGERKVKETRLVPSISRREIKRINSLVPGFEEKLCSYLKATKQFLIKEVN